MTTRRTLVIGLLTVLASCASALAVEPGFEARIAGDGPDAKYYLAVDAKSGIIQEHLYALEYYKKKGEPGAKAGFTLKDVEAEIVRVRATFDALVKKKKLVPVPYNQFVTTIEPDHTVYYRLFSDPAIGFGKNSSGTLTKVRVDDGPAKGKEYFARWLVDRRWVVISDRAWLRHPDLDDVPVAENAEIVGRYWTARADQDEEAEASTYEEGGFTTLPLETECTVTGQDDDRRLVRVRVLVQGTPHEYWVLNTIPSPVPPAAGFSKSP